MTRLHVPCSGEAPPGVLQTGSLFNYLVLALHSSVFRAAAVNIALQVSGIVRSSGVILGNANRVASVPSRFTYSGSVARRTTVLECGSAAIGTLVLGCGLAAKLVAVKSTVVCTHVWIRCFDERPSRLEAARVASPPRAGWCPRSFHCLVGERPCRSVSLLAA
jgi:hypothetical protein